MLELVPFLLSDGLSFKQEEKHSNAARVAESRMQHYKLLTDAMVLQVESKRAQLLSEGVDEDKLSEEVSVGLMADLQEKQRAETSAVSKILTDKVSGQ